jgi:hypothetical protein
MPINIKELQQLQGLSDAIQPRHIQELAKQVANEKQIRDSYLNSIGAGVYWKKNSLENSILESSFSGTYIQELINGRNKIDELMSSHIGIQNIFGKTANDIVEKLKNAYSTPIETALEMLRKQAGFINTSDALGKMNSFGIMSNLSAIDAYAKIVNSYAGFASDKWISNEIASISINHSNFLANTFKSLQGSTNMATSNALKGSIILANEQMLRSADLIHPFLNEYRGTKADYLSLIKPNRFRVQRQELVKRVDIDEDETYENLVIKSPTATIFEQIVECMLLIGECNEASETTKGKPIFKITTSFWNSAWNLQRLVATNKDNLEKVVLCFYQIIYEGAGEDNLRFLEYVNKDESEVVFVLKHFRNKWLIHDADHGSKVQKSFKERREALQWLGLEKSPTKMNDFITLNSCLLSKLNEFLKLLLERVSVFPNE